jgi:hypothetical protein
LLTVKNLLQITMSFVRIAVRFILMRNPKELYFMNKTFVALVLVLFASTNSIAAKSDATAAFEQVAPSEISSRLDAMKSQAAGLRSARDQRIFLADIEQLKTRLVGLTSFENLPEKDSIDVVNAYESLRVRAEGGGARLTHKTCERVRRTGTNLFTTLCMTQAERDKAEDTARDSMIQAQRNTR